MLESDKPLKRCNFCQKEVRNLGFHIANQHPNIMSQLDEMHKAETPQGSAPPNPKLYDNPPKTDINALIREKLDTMLNIKIIEMLSNNPNTSIQDLSAAINPPQKTTMQELKEYHDMVYGKEEKEPPFVETGNQWVDVIQQGLPIIKDMIGGMKQKPLQKNEVLKDVRGREETNSGSIKPIQLEIAGNSTEPVSNSKEPRAVGDAEQQDNNRPNPA